MGAAGRGRVTLTLAAKAFQTGAAAAAVTALFAVEPLAGVAVGALLFGETLRHTPALVLSESLGVLVCLLGVALLARSPTVLAAYTDHPTAGEEPAADASKRQAQACPAVIEAPSTVQPVGQ